jgi:hypothetical protein
MADHEISLIVGELKGEFKAIKDHLTQQDQRTESNKRMAIEARQRLEAKVDTIGEQSASSAEWIKTHGQPMAEEWARSKEKKRLAAAEFRGRAKTLAKIGAGAVLAFTALGYLGRDTWAAVLQRAVNLLRSM